MDEQWKVNVAISNANQKIREAGDLLLAATSILEESGETACDEYPPSSAVPRADTMSKRAIILSILSPILTPLILAIGAILVILSIPQMFLSLIAASVVSYELADQIWELIPINLAGRLVRKILS